MFEKIHSYNYKKFIKLFLFKSEFRRLALHMLAHPMKIPSLIRIASGAKSNTEKYFNRPDYISGPPVTVIIRVTHRCNQRCLMCGEWGEKGFLKNLPEEEIKRELSTSEITSFIGKIAYFRPFISFFGGEPLLRDDIAEIIRFTSSKHLLTTMNSNCLLLKKRAEGLVRSGLTYYKASLDGPSEVNEKIRVSKDSYKEAVEGLRHLIKVRKELRSQLPIIQMCTTVTKDNQYNLLEMAQIADEIGVDTFALLFGIFSTPGLINRSNEISRKSLGFEWRWWEGFVRDVEGMDVDAIRTQVDKIKSSKWSFRYRQYPADTKSFDISRHYRHPDITHGGPLCVLPWVRMQIMPNGDVALCEDTPDYIAGNILKDDPLKIWNNDKYIKFRKYIKENGIFPVCSRCSAIYEIPHYLNESLPDKNFNIPKDEFIRH